jgi:serralysin
MTTYYVASSSSGGGNGSATSPFHTISDAMASDLKPGDEVVVRAGVYNESVNMYKDGSAAGYITLRSEVPGGAVIHSASGGANGINITANYVAVEGFEVYGSASHGIVGDGVHHVRIANNVSHDNGASGIAFAGSDFITIEGNETYKNASSGWFSGISLYQNRNITGAPDDGSFRNIIRNNISHDNVTKSGAHTDGNGIIIDDFQHADERSSELHV